MKFHERVIVLVLVFAVVGDIGYFINTAWSGNELATHNSGLMLPGADGFSALVGRFALSFARAFRAFARSGGRRGRTSRTRSSSEHTKNKRKSTKDKHEKGQARKQRDQNRADRNKNKRG